MRLTEGLASGLFFIGFGAIGYWLGADLTLGTVADMGPGWVPRALSIVCMMIGVLQMATSLITGSDRSPVTVTPAPLLLVTAMVGGFAALLPFLGLPLTVTVCTLSAALSGENFRWSALLAIALVLAALTTGLFALALQLQIPVWPELWGRP